MHGTCEALRGRKRTPWLFASFRDFEPPEHVPRTSARPHTCTQCSRGPRTRKDPRAEEQKLRIGFFRELTFYRPIGVLWEMVRTQGGVQYTPSYRLLRGLLVLYRCCTARALLKFKGSMGWNRPGCTRPCDSRTRLYKGTTQQFLADTKRRA